MAVIMFLSLIFFKKILFVYDFLAQSFSINFLFIKYINIIHHGFLQRFMLEHPVFSSEVNDGSQKGRSVLYVLYVCSSPFSLAMYTNHIILQIAFSKLTKKFAKSKECKKQNIWPKSNLSKYSWKWTRNSTCYKSI